jgi:hypothetical protein
MISTRKNARASQLTVSQIKFGYVITNKKDFKMSGILLCNQSLNSNSLKNQCGISIDQISAFSCTKPTMAAAYTRFLGNGLAVIDFGSRVGNIHNSYQAGGNWERDLFIESSSFAASAITGTAVVNVGGAALGFLMVATPVGWVGLIVGGIAVAGVAAYSSIRVNSTFKDNGGAWYDSIMTSLGVK